MERDLALEDLCRQLLRNVGVRMRISVYWNFRLLTTVGLAYQAEKRIDLNPQLMVYAPRQIQTTLKHELAHLLSYHRAGRKRISPHGPEWQQACKDLGIPNEPITHDIPLPRRRVKRKHFYACRGCGQILARVRPAARRLACLRCCKKHNGGAYSEHFRFLKKVA